MANRLYTIGINADTSKAQQAVTTLLKSLRDVQNQRYSVHVDEASIVKASQAAQILQNELIQATNVDTGKLDLTKLNAGLANAKTSVAELGSTFLAAGSQGQAAFSALVNTITAAQAPVKQLGAAFSTIGTTLANTIKWQASSSLIHGLMSTVSGAVGYVKSLNNTLSDIRVVTGASSAEMAKFAEQANRAAKALSSTTNDFAKASLIYYQQGDDAATAAKKAEITTKAANVAFTASAQEMSEMLTAVWNSFQIGNDQLEHTVDVMAKLGATTASSMEEMATGMQKVAATANTVGVSMEQMSAMIATSASVTRQAPETIGTAWNTILSRLGGLKLGETLEDGVDLNKYSQALKTIGVNVLDATGNLRDMGNIVNEIGKKWDTLTTAQQSALAQTVGGARQYTQILAFFDNFDKYQANLKTAQNSNGALQEQQDIWAESWEAASNRSKAAMEDLWSQLINDKALIKITDFFTGLTNGITKLTDSFGGAINVISLIGSTIISSNIDTFSTKLVEMGHSIKTLFSGNTEIDQYAKTLETMKTYMKDAISRDDMSGSAQIELKYNIEILNIKQKLAQEQGKLTKAQVDGANAMIQQLQSTKEFYTALLASREQAEGNAQSAKDKLKEEYITKSAKAAFLDANPSYKKDSKSTQDELFKALSGSDMAFFRGYGLENFKIDKDLIPPEILANLDAFKTALTEAKLETQDLSQMSFDQCIDGLSEAAQKSAQWASTAEQIAQLFQGSDKQFNLGNYLGDEEQAKAAAQQFADKAQAPGNTVDVQQAGAALSQALSDPALNGQIGARLEDLNNAFKNATANAESFIARLKLILEKNNVDPKTIDNVINACKQLGPEVEKINKDAGKNLDQLKEKITENFDAASQKMQKFVQTAMTIQRVVTAISAISNAIDTLTDPDVSGWEKFTTCISTLVTVAFALSAVMNVAKGSILSTAIAAGQAAVPVTAQGTAWFFTAAGIKAFTAALASSPLLPIVAVLAVVAGLVAAIAISIGNAKKAEQDLIDKRSILLDSYDNINEKIDDQKTKLSSLSDIIKDNTLTMQEQLDKINEITKAYGFQATALDVLNKNYTSLEQKANAAQAAQLNEQHEQVQNNMTAWESVIDSKVAKYTRYSSQLGVMYDDIFAEANNVSGARASLFKKTAWTENGWDPDGNVSGIVQQNLGSDYWSDESQAWVSLNGELEALGYRFNPQTGRLIDTTYTNNGDVKGLYQLLTTTNAFDGIDIGPGTYYDAIISQLNNLDVDKYFKAQSQGEQITLLQALFSQSGGNFDSLNLKNQEYTVEQIAEIINKSIAASGQLDTGANRGYLADYLGSFNGYEKASLEYSALSSLAKSAATIKLKTSDVEFASEEDLQSKIITELLGSLDEEFTIDALLKVSPTDIVLDETGQNYTINEQVKALAVAKDKTEKAQTKQAALLNQKDLLTKETFEQADFDTLVNSGIFGEADNQDTITAVRAFMAKSAATRTAEFEDIYAAAIDAEKEGLQAQIDLAKTMIEEFDEDELNQKILAVKDELETLVDPNLLKQAELVGGGYDAGAVYEILTNQREAFRQAKEEKEAWLKEYEETDWDNAEDKDKKLFMKKIGIKDWSDLDSWDEVSEKMQSVSSEARAAAQNFEQMDSTMLEIDTEYQRYLNLQDELQTNQTVLSQIEWWEKIGSKIYDAQRGVEKFTAAMSQYKEMASQDLIALNSLYEALDPAAEENFVYDIYKNASESEWREFALKSALQYYDELARLSKEAGEDEAKLIEIEQNKTKAIKAYYDALYEEMQEASDLFDDFVDHINQKLNNLDTAIDALDVFSEGTLFSELDATQIDKIKQSLLEVGYTAEEVNDILLNLGKDKEDFTDKDTIWAAARAKTELLLKELDITNKGQQDVQQAQQAMIQVVETDAKLTTLQYTDGVYEAPVSPTAAKAGIEATADDSALVGNASLKRNNDGSWIIFTSSSSAQAVLSAKDATELSAASKIKWTADKGFYIETTNFEGKTVELGLDDTTGEWVAANSKLVYENGSFLLKANDGSFTWTLSTNDLTSFLGAPGTQSALVREDGIWKLKADNGEKSWDLTIDDSAVQEWVQEDHGVLKQDGKGGYQLDLGNDLGVEIKITANTDFSNLPAGLRWQDGIGFVVEQNGLVLPVDFGEGGIKTSDFTVSNTGDITLKDGTVINDANRDEFILREIEDGAKAIFHNGVHVQTITGPDSLNVLANSGINIQSSDTQVVSHTSGTEASEVVVANTTESLASGADLNTIVEEDTTEQSMADVLKNLTGKVMWVFNKKYWDADTQLDQIALDLLGDTNFVWRDLDAELEKLDLTDIENQDAAYFIKHLGTVLGLGQAKWSEQKSNSLPKLNQSMWGLSLTLDKQNKYLNWDQDENLDDFFEQINKQLNSEQSPYAYFLTQFEEYFSEDNPAREEIQRSIGEYFSNYGIDAMLGADLAQVFIDEFQNDKNYENISTWLNENVSSLIQILDISDDVQNQLNEVFSTLEIPDEMNWSNMAAIQELFAPLYSIVDENGINIGEQLANGLAMGLSYASGNLGIDVTSFAEDILALLADAFAIRSPSRRTMEMGKYLVEGLILGLEQTKFEANLTGFAKDFLGSLFSHLQSEMKNNGTTWEQEMLKYLTPEGFTSAQEWAEANKYGVEELANGKYKLTYNGKTVDSEQIFDSVDDAFNAALSTAYTQEKILNEYLNEASADDASKDPLTKQVTKKIIHNALQKYMEDHPNTLDKENPLQDLIKRWGELSGDFVPYFEDAYNKIGGLFDMSQDQISAKFVTIWSSALESVLAQESAEAKKVAEIWTTTFEAIGKARLAAINGESLTSALTAEQQKAILQQYLQGNRGASYADAQAFLLNPQKAANLPTFNPYNEATTRQGIAKYLSNTEGTSLYGTDTDKDKRAAYYADQGVLDIQATRNAMIADYTNQLILAMQSEDWQTKIQETYDMDLTDLIALDAQEFTQNGHTYKYNVDDDNWSDEQGQVVDKNSIIPGYAEYMAAKIIDKQYGTGKTFEDNVTEAYVDQLIADADQKQAILTQQAEVLKAVNEELKTTAETAGKIASGTATAEEEAEYYKTHSMQENPEDVALAAARAMDQNEYENALTSDLIKTGFITVNGNGEYVSDKQTYGQNAEFAYLDSLLAGTSSTLNYDQATGEYSVEDINGQTQVLGTTVEAVIQSLQALANQALLSGDLSAINGAEPPKKTEYHAQDQFNENVQNMASNAGTDAETLLVTAQDMIDLMPQYAEAETQWVDLTLEQKQELVELAAAMHKSASGFEELGKITKETWDLLEDSSKKGSLEYNKAMKSMAATMSKIFNTDMQKILKVDKDFVENHLDEMDKLANGTEEEAAAAMEAIQDDLVAAIIKAEDEAGKLADEKFEFEVIVDDEGTKKKFTEITNYFQNAFDHWDDREVGWTMTAETGAAEASVLASLNSILSSGIMTADGISAALSSIGWAPEITWDAVLTEDYSAQQLSGGYTLVDGTYVPIEGSVEDVASQTVYIPRINSMSKVNSPKGHGGGNKGGGGGGGGGNKPKKQEHKKLENEDERYYNITNQLSAVEKELEKIDQLKERAFGKNKIALLKEETKALEDQVVKQAEYVDEISEYLNLVDKSRAMELGATFDSDGIINNYDKIVERMVSEYNTKADYYSKITDEDELEKWSEYQEDWDERKAWLDKYKETLDLYREAQNELLEQQNTLSAKRIETVALEAEYKLDINDKDLKLIEYYQNKWEDDLVKSGERMVGYLDAAGLYYSNLTALGKELNDLTDLYVNKQITDAGYEEELEKIQESIQENLENLNELEKNLADAYADTLDMYDEEFQKSRDIMDNASEQLATYIDLLGSMGRGQNFKELTKFYDAQYATQMQTLASQKQYLNSLYAELEALKAKDELTELQQDEYDTLMEKISEVNATMLSDTQACLDAVRAIYDNTINKIFQLLDQQMGLIAESGDRTLSELAASYEYYTAEQDRYVSSSRQLYENAKMNRQIEDSIAGATTRQSKQMLKALQEKINLQDESNRLTQYDLDMNELQYQLALKKMALEEAQNAKDTVQLTRDMNGNYIYRYTANEDELAKKQQEYEDVLQQINDLAMERQSELESKYLETEQAYYDKAREIAEDDTLTREQKQQRLLELASQMEQELLYLQEQYEIANANLLTSNSAISEYYGESLIRTASQTAAGINAEMESVIGSTDSIIDAFKAAVDEGGSIWEALDGFYKGVEAVQALSEMTPETMAESIEKIGEYVLESGDDIDQLVTKMKNEFGEITSVTEAWNAQATAIDGVIAKYETLNRGILTTITNLMNLDNSTYKFNAAEVRDSDPVTNAAEDDLSHLPHHNVWDITDPEFAASIINAAATAFFGGQDSQVIEDVLTTLAGGPALNHADAEQQIQILGDTYTLTNDMADKYENYLEILKQAQTDDKRLILDADTILAQVIEMKNGICSYLADIKSNVGIIKEAILEQNVTITAAFPNVTDSIEALRVAFEEAPLRAAQAAHPATTSDRARGW